MRESEIQQPLIDTLRSAIQQCGLSTYRLAKNAGIHPATVSRFTKGGNILVNAASALAEYLGLHLVARPPSSLGKSSMTLADALRVAINQCGVTRYEIAKDTGLEQAALCRFANKERNLYFQSADRLAVYLGLRLVTDPDAVPPTPTPENLARPTLATMKTKAKAKRKAEFSGELPDT